MKAILIYASVHHGNTKKIAEAMAQELGADLADIIQSKEIDLSAYKVIGLASGVFFHSMHEEIRRCLPSLPAGLAIAIMQRERPGSFRKRESVTLAISSAGDMIPSGPLARSAGLRRTIPMSGIRKRQGNL